jgi:catechol 2,3-dioxygenase-like lactoylglutathione lyase family enzyme
MINGLHALIHAQDAEKVRAFFRDVLGFRSVDAGRGWLIFAMPPAELAVHPTEGGEPSRHELYMMCDDLAATMSELAAKGVVCGPVTEARWGSITTIDVPGAGKMGLYQPKHPTALNL